jgi:hypothetical protein
MRSGNEASNRCVGFPLHVFVDIDHNRVKSLESEVAELETEVERLSATLDSQKLAASEAQLLESKKTEELSRDVGKKVSLVASRKRS